MKFTDEELSRIITAHELGALVKGGDILQKAYPGCIAQVAFEAGHFPQLIDENNPNNLPIFDHIKPIIRWFDRNYISTWTTEEFIEQLNLQQFI